MRDSLNFNEAWACRNSRNTEEYTEHTCAFCGMEFDTTNEPDTVDGFVVCPSCAEGLEEEEPEFL